MKSTQSSLSHIRVHLLSPLSCATHKKYQFRSYEIISNLKPNKRNTMWLLKKGLQPFIVLLSTGGKKSIPGDRGEISPRENENPELSTQIKM